MTQSKEEEEECMHGLNMHKFVELSESKIWVKLSVRAGG